MKQCNLRGKQEGKPESVPDRQGISLGSTYYVKRRDGSLVKGEVLHKRVNRKKKKTEYYVSYLSSDRRLDEWVKGHRIRPYRPSSQSATSEDDSGSHSTNSTEFSSDSDDKEHREITKVKLISLMQFGIYEIETWYFSPYPPEYNDVDKLLVCTKCFKYMRYENVYTSHLDTCEFTQPPGRIVYIQDPLAIFEVNGSQNRLYCQNLSLLGKLFIDHKTVCYDIESFLFYILCSKEKEIYTMKAYFSKEKDCIDGYNLSCIMTLPPFQKQGYGKMLIDFSYKLSILEGNTGSPEEPISDLGLLTYKSYWVWAIIKILSGDKTFFTISDICKLTGIDEGDILYTLKSLKLLSYWIGTNKIFIPPSQIAAIVESNKFKEPRITIDESLILKHPE